MAETDIDINFSPLEFVTPSMFIDKTFWEHLDVHSSIPSSPTAKFAFYVPQTRAKKGWPEKLKQFYNVEPHVVYDSAVISLPNEISAEEIEKHRLGMNEYVIESAENPVPVPPPERLAVEDYLQSKKFELMFKVGTKEEFDKLTEKEKRIYQWDKNYGFLWDHREGKGVFFPQARDLKALKFEVVSEYFFHTPEFPRLILSVGCEPNSDQAIYGFRREASLDWPPDKVWTGVEFDANRKPKPRYVSYPDDVVAQKLVLPMNSLIRNLEYVLSK
jgi:hypothetical protein